MRPFYKSLGRPASHRGDPLPTALIAPKTKTPLRSRRPQIAAPRRSVNTQVVFHIYRPSATSTNHRYKQTGPPPPNVSKDASASKSQSTPSSPTRSTANSASSEPGPSQGHSSETPSNQAHPTLSDGRPSPYVDKNGNLRPDVPDDVKQHNVEMGDRYDRSYNQISDEGRVEKGFWSWKRD